MKSKYTAGSRNRRPHAEGDALGRTARRAKKASDNRSSDRFHSECPGTHATTPRRPRAAKPGNHEQRRQTPTDARRRSTTKRHLDERANQDVGPEKRLRHEEQPPETRAPSTPTTASRTRERGATEHDVTEGRGATRAAKTIEAIGNNIRTGDKRRPAKPEPTNESGRRRLGSDVDQARPSRRMPLTGDARHRRPRLP